MLPSLESHDVTAARRQNRSLEKMARAAFNDHFDGGQESLQFGADAQHLLPVALDFRRMAAFRIGDVDVDGASWRLRRQVERLLASHDLLKQE